MLFETWPGRVTAGCEHLKLSRRWQGNTLTATLENPKSRPISVHEVVLLEGQLPFALDTPIYGEGFQMLAQTGGTIAKPQQLGRCPDASHYRITEDSREFITVYNLLLLSSGEPLRREVLLGFSSCQRFSGLFRLWPDGRLQVILDLEGLSIGPGECWTLESLEVRIGASRSAVLAQLGQAIQRAHQRLPWPQAPRGWCSWYHYYADVSELDIQENLEQIRQHFPLMRYVQIDDGYQQFMGDWLVPSDRFPSGLASLIKQIQAHGLHPAIWVAPFIAEPDSALFRTHPDWFVTGEDNKPLAAETVTYGGWRCTPWYVLDGTHPEAQEYLRTVFRVMREAGCRYFKLDANFWGAIHRGQHHDRSATRIEAYRRGMAAIVDEVGKDCFILGCNAPLWPSLGLVHGMRVTDDVERSGERFRHIAREALLRGWQNDTLWWNDPDCITLSDIPHLPGQQASRESYSFHLAALVAAGGMMLSGDRLRELSPLQRQCLNKLLALGGQGARFDSGDLQRGELPLGNGQKLLCLLNWHPAPRLEQIKASADSRVHDFWSGAQITPGELTLAGFSGRVLLVSG